MWDAKVARHAEDGLGRCKHAYDVVKHALGTPRFFEEKKTRYFFLFLNWICHIACFLYGVINGICTK